MAQLYLPAEHTEADLILAGQIAETIDSAELYVTWTPEAGQSAPEIAAELREPLASRPVLFLRALRELWAALRHKPTPGRRAPRRAAERREAAA